MKNRIWTGAMFVASFAVVSTGAHAGLLNKVKKATDATNAATNRAVATTNQAAAKTDAAATAAQNAKENAARDAAKKAADAKEAHAQPSTSGASAVLHFKAEAAKQHATVQQTKLTTQANDGANRAKNNVQQVKETGAAVRDALTSPGTQNPQSGGVTPSENSK